MRDKLVGLICCPHCKSDFGLEVTEREDGEIKTGALHCAACGRKYPITGFVPRIIDGYDAPLVAKTAENFGNQWNTFTEMFSFYEEEFLNWVYPVKKEDFSGKIVLDAGCGMGRFLNYAAEFGAKEAIGVDMSHSVDAAHLTLRGRENAHIIQADLCNLPFRPVFDLFYSIGVMHHTPHPEATFLSVCGVLKPGGIAHTWIYGYENNAWLVNWVTPIREAFTSKLPTSVLAGVAFAISIFLHPVLKMFYCPAGNRNISFLKKLLPYFPYLYWLSKRNFAHTHRVVHDHLTAPIAFYIKRDDFMSWFDKAEIHDVQMVHRNSNSWTGVGVKSGDVSSE